MRALRLRRFGDWPLRGKMAPLVAVGARAASPWGIARASRRD